MLEDIIHLVSEAVHDECEIDFIDDKENAPIVGEGITEQKIYKLSS